MANGASQTVRIDEGSLNRLMRELDIFSRAASALSKKIQTLVPSVGSDAWWEKEEGIVDSQLVQKKYKEFSSLDKAISYLQKYT